MNGNLYHALQDAAAISSDDEDDFVYNPLKLPMGWDGKPIPYWLYKLHGLNQVRALPCTRLTCKPDPGFCWALVMLTPDMSVGQHGGARGYTFGDGSNRECCVFLFSYWCTMVMLEAR